jgi:hypothetical protein
VREFTSVSTLQHIFSFVIPATNKTAIVEQITTSRLSACGITKRQELRTPFTDLGSRESIQKVPATVSTVKQCAVSCPAGLRQAIFSFIQQFAGFVPELGYSPKSRETARSRDDRGAFHACFKRIG